MICAVIRGPTIKEARHQIASALPHVDLVELRLDYFQQRDCFALKQIQKAFDIPMIFTLRSRKEGGVSILTEEERLLEIAQLATLEPDYLDIERDVSPAFITSLQSRHPNIKWILSHHRYEEASNHLDAIYAWMREVPAHLYKIALQAEDAIGVLRAMHWLKNQKEKPILISMGEQGQTSRLLAPICGNAFSYASLPGEEAVAPGQLSITTLLSHYRYRSLNSQTSLYGLIGDPIHRSISDVTHNRCMQTLGLDALYVKMQLTQNQLSSFMPFVKKLFKGMSVTMPLKECILPYLDEVEPEARQIGAVNTLLFQEGKIVGFNTDGKGALNAIESKGSVQGKQIVLLGSGGAARAIAFEAAKRGGHVTLYTRNSEKARGIPAKVLDWEERHRLQDYDILINCTPLPMPIEACLLFPEKMIMDLTVRPRETELLKQAIEKKCRVIYGYEMFIEQAVYQFATWFKERLDLDQCRASLLLETKRIF